MEVDFLKGKRIASIDFGLKRVGVAICDELHISITPYKVFDYTSKNFWEDFITFVKKENISALVVGYPFRKDNLSTEVTREIDNFLEILKSKLGLMVFTFDESFSTKRAERLMIDLGKKKKERRRKENKDLISAAIILRDFIQENNL
ncbi:MAG: Holliday junction resolvase RuvX [Ignavibacteria bacterium]|nr:Holliday junction resolvase RuvX [Ignavibacteria bacterium]